MTLRVRSIASGSNGNAFLVRSGQGSLLLDAGLSARALERQLRMHGVEPQSLSAIVLSHEHHDHAQGAGPLARRYQIPVLCSSGTARALGAVTAGVDVRTCPADGASVADFDIWPFAVPHDAAEPVGFVIRSGAWALALALDCGHVQPHMHEALRAAQLVIVEANHDRERLLAAPYPWGIKHRIMSDHGHLSNLQAAQLLGEVLADERKRTVWLAHLSERANDHPRAVVQFVQTYLAMLGLPQPQIGVAERSKPSVAWHSDHAFEQSELFTSAI